MRLRRLQGVVDRLEGDIAVVVPNDLSREVYLEARSLPGACRGLAVDALVSLPDDPNGVGRMVAAPRVRKVKPARMASFSGLLNQMTKVRDRLRARLAELDDSGDETPRRRADGEAEALRERIAWLERGLDLFRR